MASVYFMTLDYKLWKRCRANWSWRKWKHFPRIRLEGKELKQDSRYPNGDSKRTPPLEQIALSQCHRKCDWLLEYSNMLFQLYSLESFLWGTSAIMDGQQKKHRNISMAWFRYCPCIYTEGFRKALKIHLGSRQNGRESIRHLSNTLLER
jgi:hypothetical protein